MEKISDMPTLHESNYTMTEIETKDVLQCFLCICHKLGINNIEK